MNNPNNIQIIFARISPDIMPKKIKGNGSGFYLQAYIPEGSTVIQPFERKQVKTGLSLVLSEDVEGRIKPIKLTLKHNVSLEEDYLDPGHMGEINIVLVNFSNEPHTIKNLDWIAKIVFVKIFGIILA